MTNQLQQSNKEITIDQNQNIQVYIISLSGISCMSCASKIKNNVGPMPGIISVKVNVISSKVQAQIDCNVIKIDQVTGKLEELGFDIIGSPLYISSENINKNERTAVFDFNSSQEHLSLNLQKLKERLQQEQGIISVQVQDEKQNKKIVINYNSQIIKGKDLVQEFIEPTKLNFKAINSKLELFKDVTDLADSVKLRDLIIAFSYIFILILLTIILPIFGFFEKAITFPYVMRVFSIFMIIISIMVLTSLYQFGMPVFKRTYQNFTVYKVLNMETLISIGSLSSLLLSIYLIIDRGFLSIEHDMNNQIAKKNRKEDILEIVLLQITGALIILIVYLGKYVEHKAKSSILKMAQQIFPQGKLFYNTTVNYIEPKNKQLGIQYEKLLEVSLLEKDDIIKVSQGDQLLIDAILLQGTIKVQDSIVFGSEIPIDLKEGDRIRSGAEILSGSCIAQVENVLENSLFYEIGKQLNVSQNNVQVQESGMEGLFKKFSANFVKIILISSAITLIVWIILVAVRAININAGHNTMKKRKCEYCFAIEKAVSVLVVACPCAIGLAVPSVIAISLNLALKAGILIKKTSLFQNLNKVKAICFDKTGTLFNKIDNIELVDIILNNPDHQLQLAEDEIWDIISVIEKQFTHPLALLLFKEAIKQKKQQNSDFTYNSDAQQMKKGIMGSVTRKDSQQLINVIIGNIQFQLENNVKLSQKQQSDIENAQQNGKTVLLASFNYELKTILYIDNQTNLRPETKQVVQTLQGKNYKKDVFILSGDAKHTVVALGKYLNIPETNCLGEIDALSKQKFLKEMKKQKKDIMHIGDGLNDILGLQEATVGVSINAKSELNLMASDIIILSENLDKVVTLIKLLKYSLIFIRINLFWAFSYNIFMIPIAAGVFHPIGFDINPLISAAAMSGSSIVVVAFASLLKLIFREYSSKKIDEISIKQQMLETNKFNNFSIKDYVDIEMDFLNLEKYSNNSQNANTTPNS